MVTSLTVCCFVTYRSNPVDRDLRPEDAATVDFGNRLDVLSEDEDMLMMSFDLIFDNIVPPHLCDFCCRVKIMSSFLLYSLVFVVGPTLTWLATNGDVVLEF